MTFTATGTYNGRVFDFLDGSHNITLDSNIINGISATYTSTNLAVIYLASSTENNHITISNNEINNGSYGLYLFGTSTSNLEQACVISNNIIQDFHSYGMYLYNLDSVVVSSNLISAKLTGGNSTQYGIYARYCDNGSEFSKNNIRVYASTTNYGMYIYNCDGTSGDENHIVNNFVSTHYSTGTSYGIYSYTNIYTNFYHNSVNITDGNSSSYAFYNYTGSYIVLKNNIFANTQISGGYAIGNYNTSGISESDYNCLYTEGTYLGYWSGSKSTLAEKMQTQFL